MNPLFPQEPDQDNQGYLLPHGDKRHISPLGEASDSPAVEMIRRKIEAVYAREPNARQEAAEAREAQPRSKHQAFMYRLTTSGKSMAEIQTAWHDYYAKLPDSEKHEVWQEFYRANRQHAAAPAPVEHAAERLAALPPSPVVSMPKPVVMIHEEEMPAPASRFDHRSVASIKKTVLKRVRASHNAQLKAKQHLQSLAFGLGMGSLVLLIFLFGLFNEIVIAPFIRPSSRVSTTPIILSSDAPAPSANPELIIPKINVQLPVVYNAQSADEASVQKALEDGVFHYPSTAMPGQNGNLAIFGHSSNNIFNKGRYKFAFVLLKDLEPGDIFYLTRDSKVYTYKVYTKKIVNPDETWVLNSVEGKTATAVLITCEPPGTTLHRLVVWGEQISPDPGGNSAPATPAAALQTQNLAGNGPSAWTKMWRLFNPFD